jgi:prevent-host-death family protein
MYNLYKSYKGAITMAKMSTSTARTKFSELVSKAEFAKERTILVRRKKPVAAIVPIEDIELLERYEDELDVREIRKARKEKGTISLAEVKRKLGMKP